MTHRERAAGRRRTSAQQQRPVAEQRLGPTGHALEMKELAVIVERCLVRPNAGDDLHPLGGVIVAPVVFAHLDPEHSELDLVPTGNHVEPETSIADMVGGDDLLGGKNGAD